MSMECDTRLSMMALADRANQPRQTAPRRRTLRARRFNAQTAATSAATMATFALTLFTRGA